MSIRKVLLVFILILLSSCSSNVQIEYFYHHAHQMYKLKIIL